MKKFHLHTHTPFSRSKLCRPIYRARIWIIVAFPIWVKISPALDKRFVEPWLMIRGALPAAHTCRCRHPSVAARARGPRLTANPRFVCGQPASTLHLLGLACFVIGLILCKDPVALDYDFVCSDRSSLHNDDAYTKTSLLMLSVGVNQPSACWFMERGNFWGQFAFFWKYIIAIFSKSCNTLISWLVCVKSSK